MEKVSRYYMVCAIIFVALMFATVGEAHSPGDIIQSIGMPAASVTINGTDSPGEWTGAYEFDIDYGMGDPLTAHVKALHKEDGIYLIVRINDASYHIADSLQIRFDLDHSGSPISNKDWGIEILRNNQGTWGEADNPGGWTAISGGSHSVTDSAAFWTAEVYLPSTAVGPLSANASLDINAYPSIGIHFSIYDASNPLGDISAIYTQWPKPADLNTFPTDVSPNDWGDYIFDPATTYPDISVTGVRRDDADSMNYYKIGYTGTNRFVVSVQNTGGKAIPDATDVRLNLYLAARGIGEPWHRLDTQSVLDGDCNAPAWASTNIAKNDVCSGPVSLDDISSKTINEVVANTAKYTVKNGIPMTRLGGQSITVPAGTNDLYQVLDWNTTADQDPFYTSVTVGSSTYNRQHQCMRAEAIYKNDPNTANNIRQVNMDFVGTPGLMMMYFPFSMGSSGFGKYDPGAGKDMFLRFETKNMDPNMGWKYELKGAERVGDNTFITKISGIQSRAMQLSLIAPSPDVFGKTLKENLVIPPKAGGNITSAAVKSGVAPIYVKVTPGSTVMVANYEFSEKDVQSVDLDGERKNLPSNGPAGLPGIYLTKWIKEMGEKYTLLAPRLPWGALIAYFDNNVSSPVSVSEGVLIKVPANANYLTLAINDFIGLYDDNAGTGFRVKITERATSTHTRGIVLGGLVTEAVAAEKDGVVPISEVMPTLCINGYENIGQKRVVGGTSRELYRYVGNVCWGIVNIYPRERSEKPDQGDPYQETGNNDNNGKPICCGVVKPTSSALGIFVSALGIVILQRRASRKSKRRKENNRG